VSGTIKLRLVGLALAILVVCVLIGWAAKSTWGQIDRMTQNLTVEQMESFHISDEFRANLLKLDSMLLALAVNPEKNQWDQFLTESQKLDQWLGKQRPTTGSLHEKDTLAQLNAAYDDYVEAARTFRQTNTSLPVPPALEDRLHTINDSSKRVLALCDQMMNIHHQSQEAVLASSHSTIRFLSLLIFAAFVVLLLLGGGLAVVAYHEMITPLQIKLVESRAVIERQEKLSALGGLAAGLAHEIRNPLTAIKARLFTCQKQLRPGTPELEDTTVIGQEINRLEQIVKDFLLFARPSEPALATVPASQPLQEVKLLLGAQLEKDNILLTVEDAPAGFIQIDSGQMKQVLINLVQNAADSIGRDGAITLRSRLDHQQLNEHSVPVVVLEIADTGKGIPAEVQKRLFDPFFTTKEGGTGLGLSIAARIVQKHGGALQYQTQVNHGTTFGIVLPCVKKHESGRQDPAH
jgi:signal transduction histidine kinase